MAASPFLFLAPLNGSLAFNDRAGGGTLTGAGAVRYQAASGARTNLFTNPSFETNLTGWTQAGPAITNPSDATSGSKCIEIADTTTGQGIILNTAGMGKIASLAVHTISFDAWVTSGDLANWQVLVFGMGAAGDQLANAYNVNHTFTAVKTRYSFTVTPPAGSDKLKIYIRRAVATAGTLRLDAMVCETGTLTTAQATYFDGSTGGAWLDPITGILGTAHASPSVSQAVAWVEEGTTNTIPDPSFEAATITTNWAVNGGTGAIAKVTTHAYIGSNAARVTCGAAADGIGQLSTTGSAASSGQSWTVSAKVRAFASGDVGKTVYFEVNERTAANALVATNTSGTFTLTDAWQAISYTVALAGGGTVAKVTCKIVGSAACDFVVDAVQLEQKAYATSYCDGSIGTGYAWTGTAHASSSTRTKASIVVSETNHASAVQGAFAAKFNRLIDVGASQVLFSVGNTAAATDFAAMNISNVYRLNFTYYSNNVQGGDAYRVGSIAVSTWYQAFADWSGLVINSYLDAEAVTAGTRHATTGTFADATYDLQIGSWFGTIGQLNGLIGPVAIANRPLTARERAKLYALTSWAWGTLRGSRVGLLMPR